MILTVTMFAIASSVEPGLDHSALMLRQDWCQPREHSLEIRVQRFHWTGAIIGHSVAQRRRLSVGDQFTIGGQSVRVAGIFRSAMASEENLIYTSLAYLQLAQDKDGAGMVTQHEVLLTEAADPDAVAREIDRILKSGPVATTTRRKGAFQISTLSDLVDLIGFAHWLGYACVGLVLSLVATTTVMIVQDRIKEYAVLQTIGVRPMRTMRLVLTESTIQCLLGGLSGTLIAAAILGFGGFAIGAEGAMIAFRPSVQLAVSGTLVSAFVGIFAGIVPAFQVATLPIVKALRHE